MSIFDLLAQILNVKTIFRFILLALLPAALFYIVSILTLKGAGFNLVEILRDPAQQSEKSSFLGFLSNIGVWIWVSSAAICFFAAATVRDTKSNSKRKELLLLVGTFSLLLAVDDLFLIHDRYINEYLCYAVYAFLALALMVRHYRTIAEIDGFAFLAAGSLLASSIMTDLIQDHITLRYSYSQVFEEGFKFMGAAAWLYFSFRIAADSKRAVTEKSR